MKSFRRIFLVSLMLISVCFFSQAYDKTKGSIHFEKTTFDFGNIKEDGGPVTHEFIFTNDGSEPLKITSAKAECGCTKPEYPLKQIEPGAKGKIKVTYNPAGRPGGFTKVVTIRCTGSPGKINLKIRGSVIPK